MSTGNGKIWEADAVQFRLACDARDDTYMYGAAGATAYVDAITTTAAGVGIVVYANSLTPTYQVEVKLNGSTLRTVSSGTYRATSEVIVTLNDVKVYNLLTGTLHRIDYGGVDVEIDGSTTSYGGGSLTSAGTGPCYCPVLGIPWTILGPTDFDTDGTLPEHGELTISGGWRFDQGAGWVTLPVTLPPFGASASATIPPASILSATNTWNGAIECVLDFFGASAQPPSRGTGEDMSLTLLPDLDKSYTKLGVDTSDIWYRAEMPRVTKTDALEVRANDEFGVGTITPTGGEVTVYEEESELLQAINSAASDVEDILPPASYAPCSCSSGDKRYAVVAPAVPEGQTMTFIFPLAVTFGGSAWSSYLSHLSPLVEYLSSWASPHWHIFSHFESWYLMGSNETPTDYWHPIREKWIHNTTASIDNDTRTSIVGEPTPFESGIAPFWLLNTGFLGWPGMHRFDVLSRTIRTSYTYTSASSSLWNATTGSISHGADIDLTASGGSCVFELDLGSHTVEPYLWPHIASHVTVDWPLTNVTAARVYVVGVDGENVLLEQTAGDGETTPGVTYRLPQFGAAKFAGSWAVENGFGVVTDAASDIAPDGISSTVYGGAEGAGANELGPTGTGAKLRFEFDLTGAASMDYPTLEYDPDGAPGIAVENSNIQALLWPSGPGVRFGYGSYYVAGLQNPPVLKGLGARNTMVDAYCWSKQWLLGEAYDDGLTTYINSIYDTTEIQTLSVADAGSNSCMLPTSWTQGDATSMGLVATAYFALIRNQRETPPVAWMPMKAFNTTTWARTGDYAQIVYVWSQGRRDLIAPGSQPLRLRTSGGVLWTTTITAGAVTGWTIAGHSNNVTNDEDDFEIYMGTEHLAENVHPWHGYFGVNDAVASTSLRVSLDTNKAHVHARAYTTDTGLYVGVAGNDLTWSDSVVLGAADDVAIAIVPTGLVRWLLAVDSGSVTYYKSTDGGATFTSIASLGAGTKVGIVADANGNQYLYWTDGTNIKGQIRDAAGNVVEATFTAVSGVDSGSDVAADSSISTGSAWRVVLMCYVSAALTTKTSVDGKVFV